MPNLMAQPSRGDEMTTHAHDEDARLAAVHSYGVLDGPRPPALDELTRLASSIFDTPMSAVPAAAVAAARTAGVA
jgi:hypothetical protein